MAEATTDPVRLPPAPRIPKLVQGIGFVAARDRAIAAAARRHGSEFTLNLPIFGPTVVVSDPRLVKEVFTMSTDLIGRAGTLGEVLGPGSTFSLDGTAHRQRRKLLVPPFHGKRMQGYEHIIEEEVMREIATWPEGEEFATLPSMMRITLNAILRAVFGADGAALEELRELLPPMVLRASRLAVMPPAARRDYGPWSPWGRVEKLRRRYDAVIAAADRRGPPGPGVRGPQRRTGPDAAGAVRGRLADLRRPRGRRVAHPARGGTRDHGDHTGVGGRAAPAAPAAAHPAHRRGRRGWVRACCRPPYSRCSAPAP